MTMNFSTRKNLLKGVQDFFTNLDNHAVGNDIEDYINLDDILTGDRESQLKTMIEFFKSAHIQISKHGDSAFGLDCDAFYGLSWIRLLYMSFQATDRLRQDRISNGKLIIIMTTIIIMKLELKQFRRRTKRFRNT
eukprot:Gregarina_sp_Poly_1__176@NODE_1040_length_5272_cov_13_452065_g720_i0_p2_GENE_NODE_1040_length_5272_cov_13_452065_g720_i0NODE_1040_length_5272_cov_13_452065_g720_i0_p2_ORF_typecomplete_len135_score15_57_NODE_1040_length_5272_cov_13_452065_g720_i06821086